jgi:heat shock protein HslJ
MAELGRLAGGGAAAVIALALAGAVMAQDDIRMVEGSLTYRERIALPPGALVVVEARDARGRLLGEATLASRGAQVPLGFAIGIPGNTEAELRAAIVLEGRARWSVADIAVPAGTGSILLGEVVLPRVAPLWATTALRCGERELGLALFATAAVIEVEGARRVLSPVPAASGARYEAPGDPDTWVWERAGAVTVSLGGETLPLCSVIPPAPPRPYRAEGPGWTLDIRDGTVTFALDDGRRIEAALPEPRFDGGFVHDMPGADVTIRTIPGLCRDAATGTPHPDRVEVTLGGETLGGCGGDPLDLLAGPEWVVEDIGGRGIIDASRVTLDVAQGGGLGGTASCNRYATRLTVSGGGLEVGPIASTRMGCPEALMMQEQSFFAALAAVTRFDIDPTGALVMYGAGGEPVLTARR